MREIVQAPTVALSWWCFAAIASAIFVGIVVTLLSCRVRGFRRFGYWNLMVVEFDAFFWIAVIDAVGAAASVLAYWFIVPARAQVLLDGTRDVPYLVWPLIGALGPLVAVGILKQLPQSLRVTLSHRARNVPLRSLRRAFAMEIYSTADHLSQVWYGTRDDWLRGKVRALHRDGLIMFDDLVAAIERRNKRDRQGAPLPKHWRSFVAERSTWITDVDPNDCTLRLVDSALRCGHAYAVAEACRIRLTDFNFAEVYDPGTGKPVAHPLPDSTAFRRLDDFDEIGEDV